MKAQVRVLRLAVNEGKSSNLLEITSHENIDDLAAALFHP